MQCYESSYRLANESNYYDANGTYYNIGTLEICVNGTYYPSCLDSLPESICSNLYSDNSGKLMCVVCTSSPKMCIKFSFMYSAQTGVDKKNSVFKNGGIHVCKKC